MGFLEDPQEPFAAMPQQQQQQQLHQQQKHQQHHEQQQTLQQQQQFRVEPNKAFLLYEAPVARCVLSASTAPLVLQGLQEAVRSLTVSWRVSETAAATAIANGAGCTGGWGP